MKYKRANLLPNIGTWELDLKTGILDWDYVTKSIHEVSENYFPDLESAVNFYAGSEHRERIITLVKKLISTGESFVEQFEIFTNKNNVKWVESSAQADFEDGKCILIYGTFQDITAQKTLLETLYLNEEKFQKAFEFAPIGMALVSPSGQWIKVNKQVCKITGYSEEELMTLTFQDLTYTDDLDKDLALVKQMLNKEIENYEMEKRYFHKKGHIVWVHLTVSLVRNNEGLPLYFISQINDITQQKNASEELQRERQRLFQTIEGTNIGTWEWNIQEDIMIYNERWAGIVGYTLEELKPINKKTWNNLVHPDDSEISDKALEKCFLRESEYYECEYRMKHKSGDWIWVQDKGKVIEWSVEKKPLIMLGTHADITERKNSEQELKNTLDIVSEQNKRLINFTHITSHNLRSHTGNFQMLLGLLLEETDEIKKKELTEFLLTIANDLQETIHYLNEVLQIQTNLNQQVKKINLFNETEKVLLNIKGSIDETSAIVHIDIPQNLTVNYSPEYIESVLLNLLTNAIKYRHPDRNPVINIDTKNTEKYIILKIEDNGMGIDLGLHGQKLFGMYKTFHSNKDARGLGLFIIKNQIEAMGGKIEVESEVDKGSTFKVYIKNQ
ncbi:HAMP domain-containing sensor histidine kinase [Emticicia sp. BO119]|uniref:sensor histidine kinase n=1 Tax=Emticicia sp. BO119 TaxID=2757768 RepID=UPI0015F0D55F|nr:HAMP domain-containing sensor histidine kinase [Emticicia sp. BO119]MBA4850079.1 PAS domain S-box protein [Emticicia sp. BO119]